MRKGLTEVVFILDRSGSMRGLEADTIGGFNSMLEKQKKEKGEAYISTVLFDDVSDVIYDRVSIDTRGPLSSPRCAMTLRWTLAGWPSCSSSGWGSASTEFQLKK